MNNGDPPPPVSGAGGGHQRTANGNISTDSAIAALEQHDTLFHRQVMHLRQQQAAEQLLLTQQFNLQKQLLLDNQEKALQKHLIEYLDQHRRLEDAVGSRKQSVASESSEARVPAKKSDVKHKLQEFVLQKKQREILNNINNNLASQDERKDDSAEMESTDAEVSSLLASNGSMFKVVPPRISPVQEDETHPISGYGCSPRSSRSVASPYGDFLGSLGSSSSSLLEEGRGYLAAPAPGYNPSPPRHGKLRPVGRTQSAPLPLAHPSLLAPPEVRQGKTSPDPDLHGAGGHGSSLIKQQIRHSVLNRHHRAVAASATSGSICGPMGPLLMDPYKSLDPMSAIAELSQMQNKCLPMEDQPSKARHSSTENISRGRPKPISRTRSSPLVSLGTSISPTSGSMKKTGVALDPVMLKHSCLCGDDSLHPESPGRLERIMNSLAESGLLSRCELVRRAATLESHVHLHAVSPLVRGTAGLSVSRLPCGGWGVDNDTVWNDIHTPSAAKVAAGSVTELVNKVGAGILRNGIALVRPPGHHAEHDQPLGFCFFNNVAIAAKQYRRLFNKRVLILDWDIHHGNGTQQEFYSDSEVLFVSIHRHDGGNFFPGTGAPDETGHAPGDGKTVNIAWSSNQQPLGDAEYLAAMRTVVIPIIKMFNPGVIIVSAGFDAVEGHPPNLGGYKVSPACFAAMTSSLLQLAEGKVVLALEGGYLGPAVSESVVECLKVLLGDPHTPVSGPELERVPCKQAAIDIANTIANLVSYWPILRETSNWISVSHLCYLDNHPLDIATIRNLQV